MKFSLRIENRRFFLFSLIATSGDEERGQTTVGCSVTIMCRVIQGRYLRYIQTFWGWIGAHIFSLQLSGHGPGVTVQPIIDNNKKKSLGCQNPAHQSNQLVNSSYPHQGKFSPMKAALPKRRSFICNYQR